MPSRSRSASSVRTMRKPAAPGTVYNLVDRTLADTARLPLEKQALELFPCTLSVAKQVANEISSIHIPALGELRLDEGLKIPWKIDLVRGHTWILLNLGHRVNVLAYLSPPRASVPSGS